MDRDKFNVICTLVARNETPVVDLSQEVLHENERSPGLPEYPPDIKEQIKHNKNRLGSMIETRNKEWGYKNPAALVKYNAQLQASQKANQADAAPGSDMWNKRNPGSQVREFMEILAKNLSVNTLCIPNLPLRDALSSKLARFLNNESKEYRPDGTFVKIDLRRVNFGKEGMYSVIPAFWNDNIFNEIILADTQLGSAGALLVGQLLARNPKIKALNIACNNFYDRGITDIFSALKYNNYLEELNIAANQVSVDGIKAIVDYVSHNHTLKRLHLDNNLLKENDIKELIHAVSLNNSLEIVTFTHNPGFKEQLVKDMQDALDEKDPYATAQTNLNLQLSNSLSEESQEKANTDLLPAIKDMFQTLEKRLVVSFDDKLKKLDARLKSLEVKDKVSSVFPTRRS